MHSAESYALIEKLVDDAMTENAAKRNTSYAWIVFFYAGLPGREEGW